MYKGITNETHFLENLKNGAVALETDPPPPPPPPPRITAPPLENLAQIPQGFSPGEKRNGSPPLLQVFYFTFGNKERNATLTGERLFFSC